MKLYQILRKIDIKDNQFNRNITDISIDSRKIERGNLFFLLEKRKKFGLIYLNDAIKRGAAAAVVPADYNFNNHLYDVPLIKSKNIREDLSFYSSIFYPNKPKTIVAVTGTNGKTSVVKYIQQIWDMMGIPCASIGTLGNSYYNYDNQLTTPDAADLHKQLDILKRNKIDNVALEASSHGLHQLRLDNIEFRGAAFTNISRDHLDYHKSMKSYFDSKKRLFSAILKPDSTAILNINGIGKRYIKYLEDIKSQEIITIGDSSCTLNIQDITRTQSGKITLSININGQLISIKTHFFADFQLMNSLIAAVLASLDQRLTLIDCMKSIENLDYVSGRMEKVGKKDNSGEIYIDYAHTPNALNHSLKAMRKITKNRLLLVFGAGGDRDKGKRSLMREVAKKNADFVIVTDDNPRYECPSKIRSQLMLKDRNFKEIAGRYEAINYAISELKDGDNLIICGKGHEEYMAYKDQRVIFSDKKTVQSILDK